MAAQPSGASASFVLILADTTQDARKALNIHCGRGRNTKKSTYHKIETIININRIQKIIIIKKKSIH